MDVVDQDRDLKWLLAREACFFVMDPGKAASHYLDLDSAIERGTSLRIGDFSPSVEVVQALETHTAETEDRFLRALGTLRRRVADASSRGPQQFEAICMWSNDESLEIPALVLRETEAAWSQAGKVAADTVASHIRGELTARSSTSRTELAVASAISAIRARDPIHLAQVLPILDCKGRFRGCRRLSAGGCAFVGSDFKLEVSKSAPWWLYRGVGWFDSVAAAFVGIESGWLVETLWRHQLEMRGTDTVANHLWRNQIDCGWPGTAQVLLDHGWEPEPWTHSELGKRFSSEDEIERYRAIGVGIIIGFRGDLPSELALMSGLAMWFREWESRGLANGAWELVGGEYVVPSAARAAAVVRDFLLLRLSQTAPLIARSLPSADLATIELFLVATR